MYKDPDRSFFKKHLDSLLAGALAFIILLVYSKGRIDVTTDSVTYLHAAKSIFCCHEFTQFNGAPLVDFPFFYPFFLGLIQWLTHTDLVIIGSILNGCLFAILLMLSEYILRMIMPHNRFIKWVTLALIMTSPPLLQAYGSFWSETVFNIEVLLFLIGFYKYSKSHSIRALTLIVTATAVACITRYAAVSLIACGSLLLLLDRELNLKRKLLHGSLFIAGSLSLLAVNIFFNYKAKGTLTGIRQKGTTSLQENLFYYGKVIAGWLPGLSAQSSLYILISSIIITVLIIFLIIRYRQRKIFSLTSLLGFFGLIYTLFFLTVATLVNFERIDNRFLSPVYIPLLIIGTSWVPVFIQRYEGVSQKWKMILVSCIYILLFTGQVQGNLLLKEEHPGTVAKSYTDTTWQRSDIVRYLKMHKNRFQHGYSFYSNANDALYFFTGLSSDRLPQKIDKPEINDFLEQDSIYIIWFYKIKSPDEISDTFFLNNKALKPVQKFRDGVVYISQDEDDE